MIKLIQHTIDKLIFNLEISYIYNGISIALFIWLVIYHKNTSIPFLSLATKLLCTQKLTPTYRIHKCYFTGQNWKTKYSTFTIESIRINKNKMKYYFILKFVILMVIYKDCMWNLRILTINQGVYTCSLTLLVCKGDENWIFATSAYNYTVFVIYCMVFISRFLEKN